jgi:hypothetical protein
MNTSLLVPVLLALIVLYFAYVGMLEDRKSSSAKFDAILQHYDSMLSIAMADRRDKNGDSAEELTKRIDMLERKLSAQQPGSATLAKKKD